LNASNARIYQVAMSDSSDFTVIGSDGGLLDIPVTTKTCFLAPAERIDVLVDFSKYQVGSTVTLKSLSFTDEGTPYTPLPQGAEFNIIQFNVTGTATSNAKIPTALSTIVKYNRSDAINTRQFVLGTDGMDHTINSLKFSMDRIDTTVPFNTLEVWTFNNTFTTDAHPMHVHGTQFQVASRSFGDLLVSDSGWKDTVYVRPGESVDVLVKFPDYEGIYLVHCHNLEHEDHGMMSNFLVTKQDAVKKNEVQPTSLSVSPDPASDHIAIRVPKDTAIQTLIITDIHGKTMSELRIKGDNHIVNAIVRDYPSGDYFVHLGNESVKFQVIH
jgi:FtsP/CotA-like multicopper oxidase with cupredoxin domain